MNDLYITTPTGTNIEERWIKFYGWVRPSEQEKYKAKWKYYQELPLRTLDDTIPDLKISQNVAKLLRIK